MRRSIIIFLCLTSASLLSACCDCNEMETQRAEILRLLDRERTAHFAGDASMFLAEFSDSMISVNKGTVRRTPPDSTRSRIEHYFKTTSFIKWDDAAPPTIYFSDDLTMAYAIVQKEVITLTKDSLNQPVIDTTYFAWTSIYKKHKDEWKIECNISTNK